MSEATQHPGSHQPLPAAGYESPADREAAAPVYHWTMHLGLPLVSSLSIHALILALLWWNAAAWLAPAGATPAEYAIGITDSHGTVPDAGLNWDEPDLSAYATGDPQADAGIAPASFGAFESEIVDSVGGAGDEGGFGLGGFGGSGVLGLGGGAPAPGGGDGFGEGFGVGAATDAADVWGVRTAGKRFAYVVDFSGSVVVVVDELKRELSRSIGRLSPGQQFNVFLFYSTFGREGDRLVTESFAPQLVAADAATKRRFFGWIAGKRPSGSTEPLAALQRALALKPQAVFFLSDGHFDESIVEAVTQANATVGAQIHCLVFDELLLEDTTGMPRMTSGAQRMERIAKSNGGQVRIVTGADIGR